MMRPSSMVRATQQPNPRAFHSAICWSRKSSVSLRVNPRPNGNCQTSACARDCREFVEIVGIEAAQVESLRVRTSGSGAAMSGTCIGVGTCPFWQSGRAAASGRDSAFRHTRAGVGGRQCPTFWRSQDPAEGTYGEGPSAPENPSLLMMPLQEGGRASGGPVD